MSRVVVSGHPKKTRRPSRLHSALREPRAQSDLPKLALLPHPTTPQGPKSPEATQPLRQHCLQAPPRTPRGPPGQPPPLRQPSIRYLGTYLAPVLPQAAAHVSLPQLPLPSLSLPAARPPSPPPQSLQGCMAYCQLPALTSFFLFLFLPQSHLASLLFPSSARRLEVGSFFSFPTPNARQLVFPLVSRLH